MSSVITAPKVYEGWVRLKGGVEVAGRWIEERDYEALQQSLTARAWQPIETAPKDGSTFQAWLVAPNGQWWEHQCRYNDDEAFEVWDRIDYDEDGWDMPAGDPTHWMPHPEAPK